MAASRANTTQSWVVASLLACLPLVGCADAPLPLGDPPSVATQPSVTGLATRQDSAVVMAAPGRWLVAANADGKVAWSRQLPLDEPIHAGPCVAPDSTTYVLTAKHVSAFAAQGQQLFETTPPLPPASAGGSSSLRLLALPDSSLVITDGRRQLVRLARDGKVSWRFSLPGEGILAGAPSAGPMGSIYARTQAWLYVVGHDGVLRWKYPLHARRRAL